MKSDNGARGRERPMRLMPVTPPPAARLLPWVERMRGMRALVWGDFVLDEYWRCLTRRVSREGRQVVLDERTACDEVVDPERGAEAGGPSRRQDV